jgi:putative transposase
MVFHVLNRGVGRQRIFGREQDYQAFERILEETLARRPMRICAYCVMPNHWHMVLWPERDGDLASFMHWLTLTHVARWQQSKGRVGYGHLYQGRYKSFPVETQDHFYQVVRYVERNPLRAGLVQEADAWRWSSLWRFCRGSPGQKSLLSNWPVARPRGWLRHVAEPQSEAELEALRGCANRGTPLGSPEWTRRIAKHLGLEHTLRPRGRPRKLP